VHDVLNGYYGISAAPYDRKLITVDSTLSDARLIELASKDERVLALQAAYPNEIVAPKLAEFGLNWNSYESVKAGHPLLPPTPDVYRKLMMDLQAKYGRKGQNTSVPSLNTADAPAVNDPPSPSIVPSESTEPTATPEASVSPTPTPEESIAPTATPIPTDATATPVPTDEPTATPIPTDIPVQS
jgi:hypothetical protein